jgi:hypothetical protein
MSRLLSSLRTAFTVTNLLIDNAQLRRALEARESTVRLLTDGDERFATGREAGLYVNNVAVGKLLGSVRDYVDIYTHPKEWSMEASTTAFGEMSSDLEMVEAIMYGDEEEEYAEVGDDEDEL